MKNKYKNKLTKRGKNYIYRKKNRNKMVDDKNRT